MLPKFFKGIFGGRDERTVVIQEIIENGAAPLDGQVRTDPAVPAVGSQSAGNQALVAGAAAPAVVETQAPADGVQRSGWTGRLAAVVKIMGNQVGAWAQSPTGKEISATLMEAMLTLTNDLAHPESARLDDLAKNVRQHVSELADICKEVASTLSARDGATTDSLLDAYNAMAFVISRMGTVPAAHTPPNGAPSATTGATDAGAPEDVATQVLQAIPAHSNGRRRHLATKLREHAGQTLKELKAIGESLAGNKAKSQTAVDFTLRKIDMLALRTRARQKALRTELTTQHSGLWASLLGLDQNSGAPGA